MGERVECCTEEGWLPGTIVQTHYIDPGFENHNVPYQIQLDAGPLIYAPVDLEECIRQSSTLPPNCWICFDNELSNKNPIVRECACRGEENGFVHVNCLVQLAISKTENKKGIADDDINPFDHCITCKQPFNSNSGSHAALAKACYRIHSDDPIGSYWGPYSVKMMVKTFNARGGYNCSKKLLQDEITFYRAGVEEGHKDLRVDLSLYLKDLADIHAETGSIVEMKLALDEAQALDEKILLEGGSISKVNLHSGLGRHAHLTGDLSSALIHFNKCVRLLNDSEWPDEKSMCYCLIYCAVLELELGNKKRGVDQLSKALTIRTSVYGQDNNTNQKMTKELHKLRTGKIETIALENTGLSDVARQLQLVKEKSSLTAETRRAGKKKSKKKGKKKRR